jgi:gamma-glutamylcyclotransferase (GGCT)/AIG2-like uncharacterized protein YtfP
MTDACFTYGSLMCEDIMSHVAGLPLQGEPALLAGYARHAVRDEDYPGMVPLTGVQVAGVLYRGLSEGALDRLDRFEGEMYERRRVCVRDARGLDTEAWTYVFRSGFSHRLLPGDWSFEHFLASGKARFTARYMGFDKIVE